MTSADNRLFTFLMIIMIIILTGVVVFGYLLISSGINEDNRYDELTGIKIDFRDINISSFNEVMNFQTNLIDNLVFQKQSDFILVSYFSADYFIASIHIDSINLELTNNYRDSKIVEVSWFNYSLESNGGLKLLIAIPEGYSITEVTI